MNSSTCRKVIFFIVRYFTLIKWCLRYHGLFLTNKVRNVKIYILESFVDQRLTFSRHLVVSRRNLLLSRSEQASMDEVFYYCIPECRKKSTKPSPPHLRVPTPVIHNRANVKSTCNTGIVNIPFKLEFTFALNYSSASLQASVAE
jgi:hypothetical protein